MILGCGAAGLCNTAGDAAAATTAIIQSNETTVQTASNAGDAHIAQSIRQAGQKLQCRTGECWMIWYAAADAGWPTGHRCRVRAARCCLRCRAVWKV